MTSEFEKDIELSDDERNKLAEGFLGEAFRILHYGENSHEVDDFKVFEKDSRRYTLVVRREPGKDYIYLRLEGIQRDLTILEMSIGINYTEDRQKVKDSFLNYAITYHSLDWPTDYFNNNPRAVEGIRDFLERLGRTSY